MKKKNQISDFYQCLKDFYTNLRKIPLIDKCHFLTYESIITQTADVFSLSHFGGRNKHKALKEMRE